MKLISRRPAPGEAAAVHNPYSLFDVTADAIVRRVEAGAARRDIFPGYSTQCVDGVVTIVKNFSPSVGEEVSLGRSPDGSWTYVHSSWRPGTELEPPYSIIKTTSTMPVSPTESGLRAMELCYRRDDGALHPFRVVAAEVSQPLGPEQCENVALTLQSLLHLAR